MELYFIILTLSVTVLRVRSESGALRYDESQFNELVSGQPHFVMFFAPWCGHCKRLSPTWDELAEKRNKPTDENSIVIAKVDCTVDTGLCADQDVTGYPTLKFFKPGTAEPTKYRGPRDIESLDKFIQEQLDVSPEASEIAPEVPQPEDGLTELTGDTFHTHTETGLHFVKFYAPWCGHCQKLAPIWEELAKSFEFDTTVSVSKIDCTQYRSVCNDFEVKGYPTLLWIKDGKKIEKYQGARSHEELKAFVTRMKTQEGEQPPTEEEGAVPESHVIPLVTGNFQQATAKGLVFVKFYAPWCGHCKRLAPIWDELGLKFVGNENIKAAKVDCTVDDNKELCNKEEVEGYPTLILYRDGERVGEYTGPRDLSALHMYVMNHQAHEEL